MRVIKKVADVDAHIEWYNQVDRWHKPREVFREPNPSVYSYQYVEGQYPRFPDLVVEAAHLVLWRRTEAQSFLPMDRSKYIRYAVPMIRSTALQNYCKEMIQSRPLTPVRLCHGDLTLSNTLHAPTGIVFLDPGNARGLPCRELDEAKILQSREGWDVVRHHVEPVKPCRTIRWRDVHIAFLITHYARLLKHEHPQDALAFAEERLAVWERILT